MYDYTIYIEVDTTEYIVYTFVGASSLYFPLSLQIQSALRRTLKGLRQTERWKSGWGGGGIKETTEGLQ